MFSVLTFTKNAEKPLAQTLSALVPAVVDGLLRRVVVVDQGSDDDTGLVAEGAGCSLYDEADLQAAFDALRTEWLLVLQPGAILTDGWEDAVRRHVETSTSPARFSTAQDLGLKGRLFGVKPSLDYGLLAPVSTVRALFASGRASTDALRKLAPVRLSHLILPSETTKGGA